jgi:hypothetical protein
MNEKMYTRVLIPAKALQEVNKFPGRVIQMGGKILPLEDQFDPRKSLSFHRGKCF